ncbi:hypothetical protein [Saccharothrix sp. ALI-22-I]|uniref:hypothetical protein n=1 Tax=Saccharothrix sp. ALI-22-I TaxID=1933778 RepID=UPI00117ABE16|nr:hypothetical protein [Saccharothrix sp. ALI-22-I]
MIDFRVPVQIAVVWLVMGLSAVVVGWLVVFGFFIGSAGLVAVGMIGPFAMVFLIGTFTAKASPLTATVLPRLGWAALVSVFGLVGAVFYSSVLEASEPVDLPSWLAIPGIGVSFALVAAMLAHGLVVRLVAVGVTVAAVAFGIWLPTTMPADDAASRIAHAKLPGGVLLIATPEGYDFPRLIIAEGHAELAYVSNSDSRELDAFPRLVVRPATVETTELVYRPDSTDHVFVRRMGDVEAVAVVSDWADVEAVREFVLSVRPATDDEVRRLLPQAPDRRDRDVLARFANTWNRLFT